MIDSWAPQPKDGAANALPETAHGCFMDYEDNLWLTGINDGVAQKWSHDGKKMLLQIGVKGQCDGPPDASPKARYPTCGEKGSFNSSKTLLNQPSQPVGRSESRSGDERTRQRLHRRWVRQPPGGGVRQEREVPPPVG